MTHYPDIHSKARALVLESRGRLNLREAYAELGRRSHRCRTVVQPDPALTAVEFPRHNWQNRADLA